MADSKLLVVVEGKTDATAIRAILGTVLARRPRFFAAHGRTSLVTVARNLFFHEGGPVLIVMDADTTTAHMVEGERPSHTRAAVGEPDSRQHDRCGSRGRGVCLRARNRSDILRGTSGIGRATFLASLFRQRLVEEGC